MLYYFDEVQLIKVVSPASQGLARPTPRPAPGARAWSLDRTGSGLAVKGSFPTIHLTPAWQCHITKLEGQWNRTSAAEA